MHDTHYTKSLHKWLSCNKQLLILTFESSLYYEIRHKNTIRYKKGSMYGICFTNLEHYFIVANFNDLTNAISHSILTFLIIASEWCMSNIVKIFLVKSSIFQCSNIMSQHCLISFSYYRKTHNIFTIGLGLIYSEVM